MTKSIRYLTIAVFAMLAVSLSGHAARKPAGAAIPMVSSTKGPEAGVWVIAETEELGTGYRKIVVTHDQGRYLMVPKCM